MSLFVYVYDSSGKLVNDPSGALERANNISFEDDWPGGYGSCSFEVARDVAIQWAVKQAYDIKLKDGHTIVYQGRVDSLERALEQGGSQITVGVFGYREILAMRKLRKRWVDNAPVDRFKWLASRKNSQDQQRFDANKRDDFVMIRGGYGDTPKSANDSYQEDYVGPTGHYIRRVESSYLIRTGEGFTVLILNGADSSTEISVSSSSGSVVTGNLNTTLTGPSTNSVIFQFRADASDIYDENDRMKLANITVYFHYAATHPDYASPSYTTGEILIDVLELVSQGVFSEDYDQITDPGTVLTAFATRSDKFEPAADIMDRLMAYGDASFNSYGWSVRSSQGTSDNKPKVTVTQRSTADYEWAVNLADLESFRDSLSLDELENWIIVNYEDDDNQAQCLTPDDNALLEDTASIALYGERHGEIDVGKATTAEALAIGQRRLAYRKDPLRKSELVIRGKVRSKYGAWLPVSRIQAGDRLRVLDYQGGVTFFLRSVRYKDEVATCSPDIPPDSLEVFLTRREEKKSIKE